MNKFYKYGISLFILILSGGALAQDVLSSAPSMPESAHNRPSGYQRCDLIPGGYRSGGWETWHFRCYYRGRQGVFETGHFKCIDQHRRYCNDWRWIDGSWILR